MGMNICLARYFGSPRESTSCSISSSERDSRSVFFGVFCCRASDVKNHSYDDRFGGFLLLILSLNFFFFFSFKSLLENKDGRGEGVTKLLIKEARKAE